MPVTQQEPVSTPAVGLRERKKDATRRALAERALQLATERGYDGFTIGELVADVAVSRRTFSNYFSSKAECIAAVVDGWLDDVLDSLRAADEGASLIEVLRTGLMTVAGQGVQRWGALQALAAQQPELGAYMLVGDESVAHTVSAEIAARTGLPETDIRVRLLASYAVTAGREALGTWICDPHRTNASLADLLDAAFSIITLDGLRQSGSP